MSDSTALSPACAEYTSPAAPARYIAPDFSSLAGLYRWMEYLTFGPALWLCRVHFLPLLNDFQNEPARRAGHVLVLGDGDGRFTVRLLHDNHQIQITAIDASAGMMASLLSAAEPHRDRLTAQVADARVWTPSTASSYDLIVSHFFLDCLSTPEIANLARSLAPSLAPGALWLISEFAIPPTAFGRLVAAPLVALLYRAFGMLTGLRVQSLPDYPQALRAAGWSLAAEHTRLRGLLVSQLWRRNP